MSHVKPRQPVPWMTLDEVARRTGRSVRVLQRWARGDPKKGEAPRFEAVKVGGVWIVNDSELPRIEAQPRPGRPRKPTA